MYYNNTCKRLRVIFVFKQFPIGLKQNLREEDNLSTRDKWPVPKVSSVRRFYCTCIAGGFGGSVESCYQCITVTSFCMYCCKHVFKHMTGNLVSCIPIRPDSKFRRV